MQSELKIKKLNRLRRLSNIGLSLMVLGVLGTLYDTRKDAETLEQNPQINLADLPINYRPYIVMVGGLLLGSYALIRSEYLVRQKD